MVTIPKPTSNNPPDDRGERGTLIFQNSILRDGFTQIPNAVLRDSELPAGARIVYGLLLSFQWTDADVFPGRQRMAHYLGASVDSIDRCLNALKDRGLIDWKRRGLGETNVYTMLDLPYRKNADTESAPMPTQESAPAPTQESAPMRLNQYKISKTKTAIHGENPTPPFGGSDPPNEEKNGFGFSPMLRLEGFAEFFAAYPVKLGKKKAEEAWHRLSAAERGAATISIRDQITWPSFMNRDPAKQIHAATWLTDRRWEDERPPDAAPTETKRKSRLMTREEIMKL